jgi:uncharacterized protein DUF1876/uncharacterized protein DUF1918
MRFKAGDRIEVTINTLGVPPRHGAVLASTSVGGIHVQWDDGHESVFMPGSNCQVLAPSGNEANRPVRLGCHIDVSIIEDDRECRATARVTTSKGFFEGEGIARLKPGDPQVPRIGEELALGRALGALSQRLLSVAADEISEHASDQGHLVG